jgi:hypothetical protein
MPGQLIERGDVTTGDLLGWKMSDQIVENYRDLPGNYQKIDLGGKFNAKFCYSRKM